METTGDPLLDGRRKAISDRASESAAQDLVLNLISTNQIYNVCSEVLQAHTLYSQLIFTEDLSFDLERVFKLLLSLY